MTPDEKAKLLQETIQLTQVSIGIACVVFILVVILFIGLFISLTPRRY